MLRTAARRVIVVAAIAATVGAGVAGASAGGGKTGPEMRVEPSTTGLRYSQTVRVVAENLRPRGTGYTAITICGITDDRGNPIARPGRDDCAGTDEIGDLLIVVANDDGRIDESYTLPAKGRRFGENRRQCNVETQCALVVADAAASGDPAYQVSQVIRFRGQHAPTTTPSTTRPPASQSPGNRPPSSRPPTTRPPSSQPPNTRPTGSHPATTQPAPATTTTQPAGPGVAVSVDGEASANPEGIGVHVDGHVSLTPPAVPAGIPGGGPGAGSGLPGPVADALREGCSSLAAALADAPGVDPATLAMACAAIASGDPTMLALLVSNPELACGPLAGALAEAVPVHDASTYQEACATAMAHAGPVLAPVADAVLGVVGASG